MGPPFSETPIVGASVVGAPVGFSEIQASVSRSLEVLVLFTTGSFPTA